jgi:hypothetical protein
MKERLFSEGYQNDELIDLLRHIRSARRKLPGLTALIDLLEALESKDEGPVPFVAAYDLVEAYILLTHLTEPDSLVYRVSREDVIAEEIPRLLLVDTFDRMIRVLKEASAIPVEINCHLYSDDHGQHLSAKINYGGVHLEEPVKEKLSSVFEALHHALPKTLSRSLMIREDGLRLCLTAHNGSR